MADHGGGADLCSVSVVSCLLLACGYVGSLYVWRSRLPRDHPTVIKRRFTSVLVVSALAPLWVWMWRQYTGFKTGPSLLALMGIHLEGIFAAACFPLLLTMVLFVGPLIQLVMDYSWDLFDGLKMFLDPRCWVQCLADMRWMRNQVVAPLTEELVFRACMLPMLVPCTGLSRAIVTCPLFFGVAATNGGGCGDGRNLKCFQELARCLCSSEGNRCSFSPRHRAAEVQTRDGRGHLPLSGFPVFLHGSVRGLHSVYLHQDRSPHWPGSLPFIL
ncbi:CAAX prenyl protease 2 isoform X2 [Hypanus sabinus]|uniref:CAAX prenyl protease 2 isoform X2 n=1 Tax=Hypanus sabinus TaxID=79690 RepID=UPI0028C49CF2|nr:CAAX prenyl protease 2 isoform X2 [Hypanus sabinus]